MNKLMNKTVHHISVMIFMFCFSLIGLMVYIYIVKKKASEQSIFFRTTVNAALKEGINKDSIKSALIKSDTLK